MNDAAKPLVASADRTVSGLEFLRKIAAGEYANVPIGDHLGFRLAAVEKGRVTLVGRPDERSYNLLRSVHGGWTAAILDTAMALSNLTLLAAEQTFTTLDIRINYLRPVTDARLEARARVVHAGKSMVYLECEVVSLPDEKLVAKTSSTCLILRGEQAKGR